MPVQTDLGHGRGWLTPGAAASIRRIDAALGHPLQITEAGRTYERQLEHWNNYQRNGYPIALHPDTPSIHQLGDAIDTDEGQQRIDLLAEHGWVRTVYRQGRLVEPWHFEYSLTRDEHRNDPDTEEEWLMGAAQDVEFIKDQVGGTHARKTSLRQDVDELGRDVEWLKQQVGGSEDRKTSLRQDVTTLTGLVQQLLTEVRKR